MPETAAEIVFANESALMAESDLIEGWEYIYARDLPRGCKGQRYRLHREVVHVPTYQHLVLVEALTGWDKGLWFVCSVSNFLVRYVPAPQLPA
jgi:hypothetical protein